MTLGSTFFWGSVGAEQTHSVRNTSNMDLPKIISGLVSKLHGATQPLLSLCIELGDQEALASGIGAKPKLFCEAIELVCGGSPKLCVLVEWKALDRVKSEL